jgi:RNA polymerase sigma-70 factor (ECF subfamily)
MSNALSTLTAAHAERSAPEDDSQRWLAALRGAGHERDQAVADLHGLMLRAARYELGRRRAALSHVRGEELDDIAMQAADDAVVAVLAKLDDFRGADREVVLEPEGWTSFADRAGGAQAAVEQTELLAALREAIDEVLTPHQRQVFSALALNEVPIDVLAERMSTTRGALYKTLHDARKRLREHLGAAGLLQSETETQREE